MAGAEQAPLGVACVSVSSALGGSERGLLDFVVRAPRHAIAPVVIVPKPGPLVETLRSEGVPTLVAHADDAFLDLSQRTMISLQGLAQLVGGARRWSQAICSTLRAAASPGAAEPHLLYSNGFKAHLTCALLTGHRRVWHLHEYPPSGLGALWQVLAAALPDATIANSRSVAAAWRVPLLPMPSVVLNGVDLKRFRPTPRSYWIHDLLDLPHEARLIGMPAVFARWKGHVRVIEAFERVAARIPYAHLALVGGPIYDTKAERGYAEELVRRVGRSSLAGTGPARSLTDRIHFVRFVEEAWRLYPEFDLVIHFSTRPEPFGRVVVEAMASGIPVIAARAGGPEEIVEDGVTGWLTTPGDVDELGARIVAALAADAPPLGAAARRVAEARFSADRFAAEVAEVLLRAGRPEPRDAAG